MQAANQKVHFDLSALRTTLKRQREAAAADSMAKQQSSKKGRFTAASLQVSRLHLCVLCAAYHEMHRCACRFRLITM